MKLEASFSATCAWKEWSGDWKLDLWSHPQAEELSVKAKMQDWEGISPRRKSTQQPTIEARNSRALFETLPWRWRGKLYLYAVPVIEMPPIPIGQLSSQRMCEGRR